MIHKEKFEVQAMDYMMGAMPINERKAFEDFLAKNQEYNSHYQDLVDTWKMIDALNAPTPSEKMDQAFFTMLSDEMANTKKKTRSTIFLEALATIFKPQLAYGLLLLGIGLGIGYYINAPQDGVDEDAIIVNQETENIRQKLVLTLLEQPSASQRLQGVSEANKIENVDETVVKALLQTLNSDSNVNVRLAAIESLTNYVDNPLVRQGLVQSIPNQESPIIQVTLANLMVALQEKTSVEPFRQLLKEKEMDTTVKKKIKNSIESII
ncbi:HEAT repeat domain-containing protein [Flagellimonas sp. HMM57]|uniref:HEAT repeat domain-containing protein n=1 Tax=unclassified Flagellimonas TaxID=2644544 RepID=UPI0013D63049|nr:MULTISPECIES: HEAT repeat domain-containing protein [unclassified Flagellimonas]UII77018.1 HEAT repeat domain-containing protein [Flagellimonas sp. HMM57]